MGYTTEFFGEFRVSPKMKPEHIEYINAFSSTRRMKRDPIMTAALPDPIRLATDLEVGVEGGYYVGDDSERGAGVLDHNNPPHGQPELYCQWVVTADGEAIHWDGGEKFYEYRLWLEYLITHFLKPWGYEVNGVVEWEGEDREDRGRIIVERNRVGAQYQVPVQWSGTVWEDNGS